MCTSLSYRGKRAFFGRNLDYDVSFGEEVVFLPRNFPLLFRRVKGLDRHYAILGMAHVESGVPLFYDAMNECGLAISALNFPGNATYYPLQEGRENVASFELIPYLLGQAKTVDDVLALLMVMNLDDDRFSESFPPSPLHFHVADKKRSIVIETLPTGMKVHENPLGVLTNNPPFEEQMERLADYVGLSPVEPKNAFAPDLPLAPASRGYGAKGLPGDITSPSRFVRAAFALSHTPEDTDVSQFFHLLANVENVKGVCLAESGRLEHTLYSCCCDLDELVYHYATYACRGITSIALKREDLEAHALRRFPLPEEERFAYLN